MIEGITWFKQSAFSFQRERVLYIDPWGITEGSPKADAILYSHGHGDHFDLDDLARIRQDSTAIYAPADVAAQVSGQVNVVAPGDAFEVLGYSVDAVPAYNVKEERLGFHPRSSGWVGYVFTIDGIRYYHAGDSDLIPEMEPLSCDVALIPIGGHYTMDVTEAAEAVKVIKPRLVVPMHFGFVVGLPSDAGRLAKLVAPTEVHVFVPRNPFER
jgi:L-ascorbate metabolism protein UlaG (beta-lactamase superfamily)